MSGTIKLKLKNNGTLDDPGIKTRKVKNGENIITWKIIGNGIDSFRLTSKCPNEPYPFEKLPDPSIFQKEICLKVIDVDTVQEWDYNIIWRKDPNDPYGITVDPKIVIEPDTGISAKVLVVIVAAVLLACIPFAFKFFKRKLR